MTQYQVAYEGQIITDPLDMEEAIVIAVEENIDATEQGHLPLAEVVIALPSRTIPTHRALTEILLASTTILTAPIAALYLVASLTGNPSKQQKLLGGACLIYFPSLVIALACKAYTREKEVLK